MNIKALLTFYLINSHAQFTDRNINEEIANSMIYVIERFFEPRGSSFIIVMSFERETTKYFYQDLSEILFASYDNIKTQIVLNEGLSAGPYLAAGQKMRIFNMLVVDSLNSFINIDLANKVKNHDVNEFYHIFLHNKDRFLRDDIQGILSYCWSNYIINVNVVIQTAFGDIIVYTYFPFSETHCNEVVPIEINRFKNGAMVNAELFPEKLQSMHKCPIRVAPFHGPPFLAVDLTKTSSQAISGFEGQLLNELSFLMNFTIEIVLPPNDERGSIFSNYSTGAINMLVKRDVDLSLGSFWFTRDRSRILTASDSYFQTLNVAVLVKNSVNYEYPHVFWFPYESEALVAIITSFVIMLGMVFILENCLTFLASNKKRSRCLNFIAWTLGLPSYTLPIQASRRIFVMTWILFGLINRSQYAGIIYHLLRNNIFRKSPSTIKEVVSLKYTIILNKDGYNALKHTSIFADTGLRHKIIDFQEHDNISLFGYLEEHPQERLFVITPLGYLLHYMGKNHKADVLTTLKESFMLQNICIYFTKHSFLVDRVNLLIQRMYSSGLIKSWVQQAIDWSYLKSPGKSYEVVIGQRELKGIYYIWLIMMMVAFLVFCLEKLSEKCKLFKRILDKLE